MRKDDFKLMRRIHVLARRLPWIVVACVVLTVIAVVIQLLFFNES